MGFNSAFKGLMAVNPENNIKYKKKWLGKTQCLLLKFVITVLLKRVNRQQYIYSGNGLIIGSTSERMEWTRKFNEHLPGSLVVWTDWCNHFENALSPCCKVSGTSLRLSDITCFRNLRCVLIHATRGVNRRLKVTCSVIRHREVLLMKSHHYILLKHTECWLGSLAVIVFHC